MKRVICSVIAILCVYATSAQGQQLQGNTDNTEITRDIDELRGQLRDLTSQINNLSNGLVRSDPQQPPNQPTGPSGNTANAYAVQTCPIGYYAVGIQAWGSPGSTKYCIGCLTGVALICKPFPGR